MLAIKIGGSVIAGYGRKPVFLARAARAVAADLARLRDPFILVHGTGSYGKPPAERYGYLSGRIRPGQAPVAAIGASLLELHALLIAELTRAGVRAVSCPGRSFFSLRGGRPALKDAGELRGWLRRGFSPVINSDIFPAAGGEFRVVSSDAILCEAAVRLGADMAVFLTSAAGVIGPRGRVLARLDRRSLKVLLRGMPSSGLDVSGGMKGKLEEIARVLPAVPAAVLDGRARGSVLGALSGKAPGTYISA